MEKGNIELPCDVVLCGNNLWCNGQVFTPDAYTAYLKFHCAFTIPSRTWYGTMLHPQVVRNSYAAMKGKQFDLEHQVRALDKENIPRDRILGSIMEVEFPYEPEGGWKFSKTAKETPHITGVAALHKLAEGADRLIGGILSGRKPKSVSMEMHFFKDQSGFLLESDGLNGGWGTGTPANLREGGFSYVPWADAPEDLRNCWSSEKGQIVADWKGKKTSILCGGLNGTVELFGLGLVETQGEPDAYMERLAASGQPGMAAVPVINFLKSLQKVVD